jgi:putative nucleotidyltransferase with HDIG domain
VLARRVESSCPRVCGLLHDIGYAPSLVATGFHPVDGARFLRAQGTPEVVVSLVAHHSGAVFEAEQRGLAALRR